VYFRVHTDSLFMNRERVSKRVDGVVRGSKLVSGGLMEEEGDKRVGFSAAARLLGCTRQNVYQQALKGRIPCERDEKGGPSISLEWILNRVKEKSSN